MTSACLMCKHSVTAEALVSVCVQLGAEGPMFLYLDVQTRHIDTGQLTACSQLRTMKLPELLLLCLFVTC